MRLREFLAEFLLALSAEYDEARPRAQLSMADDALKDYKVVTFDRE